MKKTWKRLTAILLAMALCCTCVPALPAAAETYADFTKGQYLVVTTPGGVRMHENPDTSAQTLMILTCGTHLQVLDITTSGWLRIKCGNTEGWSEAVKDGWFATYTDKPEVYSYSSTKQAVVLANALNVHSEPVQLSSNIIDDLSKGQAVNATGYTDNGWIKVEYYRGQNKIVGYVSASWVELKEEANTTYTTPEQFTEIYGWSARVKTSVSALNVHVSPSTNASIITTLRSGEVVPILAESAHWYRVSFNEGNSMITGYIYKSYTKILDAMENLRLNKTSKKMSVGKKYHLLIRGNTGMELETAWKSSNKKIASVNKNGYVTAKKKGTVTISCTITVGSGSTQKKQVLKCTVKVS